MRQKGFILLPVVIIIALLGVVGYLVYQNAQLRNGGGGVMINSPVSSSVPVSTANWKTFLTRSLNYSIKYPPNLTPSLAANNSLDFSDSNKNLIFSVNLSTTSQLQINSSWPSFAKIKDSENHTWNTSSTTGIEGNMVYSGEYLNNGKVYSFGIWINENNFANYVSLSSKPSDELASQEIDFANQILSTFKFKDKECPTGSEPKICKLGPCCCPVGAICD